MSFRIRVPIGLLFGVLLLGVCACAGSRPSLDGVWEKVDPDPARPQRQTVKILTDGHFAFGTQSPDGQHNWSGGGTYTLDGNLYTETIAYHWIPSLVGRSISFTRDVKDGLWYHKAVFDVDDRHFNIDEVWRRVAPAP